MHKLRTIIVDDEPLALNLLRAKLNKVPEIEIIAECKNGREAIEKTMDLAPDLIFLDIQMPGVDGFGVIKKLQSDIVPLVIFTTAFEQYALDAFDVHAVDYILKPIDEERITRAVSRAIVRFETEEETEHKSRIIGAIDTINERENSASSSQSSQGQSSLGQNKGNLEHKIIIKDRDDITLLKQADIEWVDAAGDYCCVHAQGVTHIKRSTLKNLLDDLDPSIFKRVHRSTIVNLNYIQKVIPHTKGEYFLKLGEYDQVKVSRNYRDVIKDFLSDW
ncbi:LytR/AlgR family response regulator transcription factor [Colwellia psychrerythraea]|uniref:Response regulator n=1 Tax=Colwellia psychrerythraea (strain 34H / ATCC BAA-681) TaxID=167879 RepID=Q47XT5_COLP3|nr:response regulator transcription factor [Colwellia psychrerythraea]AAZ25601.1 response regulator [Colwellia psychrerythraea 34H]